MANSKVKGGKVNCRPLMGETEQPYGKSDECMKGNVICREGDQQAYQMKKQAMKMDFCTDVKATS